MKTLIIIPAYNEEKSIVSTLEKLFKYLNSDIDYIIINDGSTDNTEKICKEHHFNIINLPCNLGIGGAVQTGYIWAYKNNYDIAIQMDADGQHNPKYIKYLIKEIENGNDLVIGSRFLENKGFQSTFVRRIGINLYCRIIRVMTRNLIKDTTSGYRAVNKKIIEMFAKDYPIDYPEPETNAIVAKKGYKVIEVPMQMSSREKGKSSITPIKSIYYALKVGLAVLLSCIFEKEVKNG
jgi:hypothetical protein